MGVIICLPDVETGSNVSKVRPEKLKPYVLGHAGSRHTAGDICGQEGVQQTLTFRQAPFENTKLKGAVSTWAISRVVKVVQGSGESCFNSWCLREAGSFGCSFRFPKVLLLIPGFQPTGRKVTCSHPLCPYQALATSLGIPTVPSPSSHPTSLCPPQLPPTWGLLYAFRTRSPSF